MFAEESVVSHRCCRNATMNDWVAQWWLSSCDDNDDELGWDKQWNVVAAVDAGGLVVKCCFSFHLTSSVQWDAIAAIKGGRHRQTDEAKLTDGKMNG